MPLMCESVAMHFYINIPKGEMRLIRYIYWRESIFENRYSHYPDAA
jgi:hypothetical protein